MHDTDSLIKNITGSNNYLKELEKITGNMEHIDIEYFKVINTQNYSADKQLRSILKKILTSDEIVREFFKLSIETDYSKAIEVIEKVKKNKKSKIVKREIVTDKFKPKKFIKSEYFKIIKKIEKQANTIVESYGDTFDKVLETIHNNPELQDTKNFFGYKLIDEQSLQNIIDVRICCNTIIDNYMRPLYDMRQTIVNNWSILDKLFKSNSLGANITEIQNMLYVFMLSKYRCMITDNDKYYVKLFMNIVSNKGETEAEIGKMDSSRFLELLDTIDFESIDKKQKVYDFATSSKDIIKRILKKEEPMENIMKDVNDMMQKANKDDDTDVVTIDDLQEDVTEHNEILSSLL